jgi:hypothetical protein
MENSRIEEFRLLAMIGKPGRKSAAILELCDEVGRLQKRNGKRAAFLAPVIDDVALYGKELGLSRSDCQAFIDYHQARGWKLGRTQMVDWRAALRTWKSNRAKFSNGNGSTMAKDPERWNDFLSQTSAKYRGEHRYAPEYLRLEFSRWLKIK